MINHNAPSGWKLAHLSDAAHVSWGDTKTTKASYVERGYVAFSATGPDGFLDHYDHEGPGIVLSAIGAQCGKTWYAHGKWSCIKNTIYLKARADADARFLYYATCNPDFWPKRGAAQPFISQGDARRIQLLVPPLDEQRRIASILGAYDDLIEVNQRRMAVLEATARGLFEEWFVRCRFPGHSPSPSQATIPDGWVEGVVGDLGHVVTGRTPSKANAAFFGGNIPFVKIPDMHDRIYILQTSDTLTEMGARSQPGKTIPAGSVCVSCIGTIGLVAMNWSDCQTNQQINSVVPRDKFSAEYLFCSLKAARKRLENLGSNGATMGNVNKSKFENLSILVPGENLLRRFHTVVEPIFAGIASLQRATETLAASRDLLRPRLLSGDLSLDAATREPKGGA